MRTRGGIHGTDTHTTQNPQHTSHKTRHTTHRTPHTTHSTQRTVHNAQHNTHIKHKIGRHGQPHNHICCTTHCKSDLSFEQEAAVRRGLSRHRAKDVSAAIELVLRRLLARCGHEDQPTSRARCSRPSRLTLTPYWRWLFVPMSPLTSDCQNRRLTSSRQCTRRRSCCCLCGIYGTTCTSMAVGVPLSWPCN